LEISVDTVAGTRQRLVEDGFEAALLRRPALSAFAEFGAAAHL